MKSRKGMQKVAVADFPHWLTQVPQFERADVVLMGVCGFFHGIFGTTFSIILDWRGI